MGVPAGRRAILARQKQAEGVCPGCECAVDLKDAWNDCCPHGGIG